MVRDIDEIYKAIDLSVSYSDLSICCRMMESLKDFINDKEFISLLDAIAKRRDVISSSIEDVQKVDNRLLTKE